MSDEEHVCGWMFRQSQAKRDERIGMMFDMFRQAQRRNRLFVPCHLLKSLGQVSTARKGSNAGPSGLPYACLIFLLWLGWCQCL